MAGTLFIFCSVLHSLRPAKTPQRVSEGYVRNDGIERPHARSVRDSRFLGKTISRYTDMAVAYEPYHLCYMKIFVENYLKKKLFVEPVNSKRNV